MSVTWGNTFAWRKNFKLVKHYCPLKWERNCELHLKIKNLIAITKYLMLISIVFVLATIKYLLKYIIEIMKNN